MTHGSSTSPISRLLHSPFVRMLLAGIVLYAAHALVQAGAERREADPELIEINADELRALADGWKAKRGRSAQSGEMEELLQTRIREEILSREAIAMGMDVHDPLIRRQLAQKVTFLLDGITSLREPTEAEIREFLDENRERFAEPGRVSFEHRLFRKERHLDIESHIAASKKLLEEDAEAAKKVGDPSLLPEGVGLESEAQIARVFGQAFAEAALSLEGEGWQGPIKSTYGLHLVRILAREAGRMPPLAEIREQVVAELRSKQQREALDELYARLRDRYRIEVDRKALETILAGSAEAPR